MAVGTASIAEVQERYRRKELSPVEVTRQALERAERLNPTLNAFITLTGEQALDAARASEARVLSGEPLRPLEGIPVSVKDLYQTAGIRTTCASPILADWIPAEDATVVARLKQVGAVLLGKTHMLEFAYAAVHPAFGDARNPWNTDHRTGGSSSGSGAGLAAGIGYGSFGSDTGGSIRVPASYCGLVGVKPTYGRISLHGVFPLAWSLDHAGPMARTVADATRLLQVTAGADPLDPFCLNQPADDFEAGLEGGVSGLTLGVSAALIEESADPEVAVLIRRSIAALEAQGARIVEVSVPAPAEVVPMLNTLLQTEAAAVHRAWFQERPQDYSATVAERLRQGMAISGAAYAEAARERVRLTARCRMALEAVDGLIIGSTPSPAAVFGAPRTAAAHDALVSRTGLWNLTGFPAISVPCGLTGSGLPAGLQVVGLPLTEALLLRIARAVERNRDPWVWPDLDQDARPSLPTRNH